MTKTTTDKTNGHPVTDIKPAPPKTRAKKAAVAPAQAPAPAPSAAEAEVAIKPARKVAAKPAAKTVSKTAAKTVAKPAVKAAKPATKAASPTAAKPAPKSAAKPAAKAEPKAEQSPADIAKEKARKPKLVRDSFTMPEQEYAVLGQVKKACLKAGFEIRKSELLRIGVALISDLDIATLQKVLSDLPTLKTGRPKSE